MITVLLADDQPLVRAGLRALLDTESDLSVLGEAADGREAVRQAAALRPDVVLMDIRMPELDGLEATRRIVGARTSRVVVVTTFDLDEYVYEALRAGASGFLVKDAEPGELRQAVRVAARGDALLSPGVTRRLIERFAATAAPRDEPRLGALTPREREVLGRIAQGQNNGQIAETLFMSPATVKTHVNRIMAKLGLHDRAQLVVLAYESGLIRPGGV
ncbi:MULTISPECIES: response regulator [Nonomuraea]|uniref:Response regulator n=1 Tax=Nonomuraea mangrovi TaxID=2316207 RepID=A0ABW4SLW1_9ACTN